MTTSNPSITIITPTARPKDLYRLLQCVNQQTWYTKATSWLGVDYCPTFVEHIIVSEPEVQEQTKQVLELVEPVSFVTRKHLTLAEHGGQCGAIGKDFGLMFATGDYVVFWDDDNWFFPFALRSSLERGLVSDGIAVLPILHNKFKYRQIPDPKSIEKHGRVTLNNIDTACMVFKRRVARQGHWTDEHGRGTDWRYFHRILVATGITPLIADIPPIGVHL